MRLAIAFLTVGPANFHSRKKIEQRRRDAEQHLVALWPELRWRLGDVVLAFGGAVSSASEVHAAPPAISVGDDAVDRRCVGPTSGGQFGGTTADVGDGGLDVLLGCGSSGFGGGMGLGTAGGDATVGFGQRSCSLAFERLAGDVDALAGLGLDDGQLSLVLGDLGFGCWRESASAVSWSPRILP